MNEKYKKLYNDLWNDFENYKNEKENQINELKYYNKELEKEIEYLNEKCDNLESSNLDYLEQINNLKLNNKNNKIDLENKSLVSSINIDKSLNDNNKINYKTLNNIDKLYTEIIKAKNYIQSKDLCIDKKIKIINKKEKFENAFYKISKKYNEEKKNIKNIKSSVFKKKHKNIIFETNNISEISLYKKDKQPNSDSKGNMFKSTFIDGNTNLNSKKNSIHFSNLGSESYNINEKIYEDKLKICNKIIESIKNINIM